jgi:hypothetical protein
MCPSPTLPIADPEPDAVNYGSGSFLASRPGSLLASVEAEVGDSVIDLERCARRVYELHRARDVRRGRSRAPIPTWEQLDEAARSRLIAEYWRARSSYDAGRRLPREVRIA